jgi:hypothetical protein
MAAMLAAIDSAMHAAAGKKFSQSIAPALRPAGSRAWHPHFFAMRERPDRRHGWFERDALVRCIYNRLQAG